MTTWLYVLITLVAAVAGMAVAWVAARWYLVLSEEEPDEQAQFAQETLSRLQELTRKVKADVDQHSSCVEEIQAQLSQSLESDDESVLAAVSDLIEANQRMQRQLDTAEERLQAQARQIESQAAEARTDALTQLANRRAFDDELRRCAADHQRRGMPATLILFDVDHFKRFNDTHGHQTGDEVLRGVARVLRSSLGDMGLVARYGGEEFAVVCSGLSYESIVGQAERARQAVAGTQLRTGGKSLSVTLSSGLADLLPGDDEKEIVRRADEALYSSKKAGRNCAHYNDGRTNHFIKPEQARILPPVPIAASSVGDEWLFESEESTEVLAREPIPQVSSRPAFFDDLIRRLSQWRRGRTPLALLLVQVDSLPRIVNDHGPSASEVVLRVTAQLINAVMRDMDHVARLGEDTFALILPGALLADSVGIAERLRHAVERCRLPRKAGASWFTVSIGVVEASDGDDMRQILQRGRMALAAAVNQGRNCVVGHDAVGAPVRTPEMAVT
ncbi:MAG TPA: diguanylate cyclase [Pirellulaceae bacterium]|nr:diguanylate cyclase [Pirellulaceae bacterium]